MRPSTAAQRTAATAAPTPAATPRAASAAPHATHPAPASFTTQALAAAWVALALAALAGPAPSAWAAGQPRKGPGLVKPPAVQPQNGADDPGDPPAEGQPIRNPPPPTTRK